MAKPQTKIGQKLALLIPAGGGGPAGPGGAPGGPAAAAAAAQAAGAAAGGGAPGGGGMKLTLPPQVLSQAGVDPSQLQAGAAIQIQADAQVLGMGPQGATIMISDLQISPGQGTQSGPGGASPGGDDGDADDQEYQNAWKQGPPQS